MTKSRAFSCGDWHEVMLYRCHARNGSTHSFAPTPGHLVRRFHYPAAEIAHALVLLGRGSGFHQAALEARERTNRKASKDTNVGQSCGDACAALVASHAPSNQCVSPAASGDDEGAPRRTS